jgi:hypothetical protein
MSVSLESRLRYIFTEGLIGALKVLGWKRVDRPDAMVFTKKVDNVVEVISFRNNKALNRREVIEALDHTRGISYKVFEKEYVSFYKGEPPLMPL